MGSERSQRLQRERSRTNPDSHTPSTPVESLAKRTAYTRDAATTTKARRRAEKTEIPSSVTTSSLRPRRVRGLHDWDSQITLTQIVSQTESPHADGDGNSLEYDGREYRDARPDRDVEVIDLVNASDDDSVPRTSRESTAKKSRPRHSPDSIPRTTFKTRKSVDFNRLPKKNTSFGKSTSGGALKGGIHGNKTLTQMDFVRRYIPLPLSDDDLQPYDEDELLKSTSNSPSKAVLEIDTEEQEGKFPSPRKRQKLSDDSAAQPSSQQASQPPPMPSVLPKTPQKVRKFEIPSSQTPETPRQEILASTDTRNVPRFSLEKHTRNKSSADSEELLGEPTEVQAQKSSQIKSTIPETAENSVSQDTRREEVELSGQSTASVSDNTEPQPPGADRAEESSKLRELPPSSFSKMVVYDTDDEDDLEEDDGAPQLPRPENSITSISQHPSDAGEELGIPDSDDSTGLPPHVPNSGTDLNINCNAFSDTALPSDASVYYRRPAQYTQYPSEPVPILDTQKMAELFPAEEGEEPFSTPKAPSHMDKENWPHPKSEHADANSPHSEAPTQSDEAQKSTQMVPESSPIARHYEDEIMPPPREPPVVLVESSQIVDRINRQNSSLENGPAPPRLLSARDFLTDSVMESIPPPPWALSQDSVGEPYPEESRR